MQNSQIMAKARKLCVDGRLQTYQVDDIDRAYGTAWWYAAGRADQAGESIPVDGFGNYYMELKFKFHTEERCFLPSMQTAFTEWADTQGLREDLTEVE